MTSTQTSGPALITWTPTLQLWQGDCLAVLRSLPDSSVHSVVTDPPYGLSDHTPDEVVAALIAWVQGDRERVPDGKGFMGRSWDRFVPPPAVWDECLRVLKPGGYMAVFAGSRTADLMGLSIRLAGFEIRDTITWLYATGFPKSRNISNDPLFCQCDNTGPVVPYSHGDSDMHRMRQDVPNTTSLAETSKGSNMLTPVQWSGERTRVGDSWAQGPDWLDKPKQSVIPNEDDRSKQSSVEGWNNFQAIEGELSRSEICQVPSGLNGDGSIGRLHSRAPQDNGALDRSPVNEDRVRQSHRPQFIEQQTLESGAIPNECRSQTWGSGPLCKWCSKPTIPAGVGTALKPASEPIIVARKPFPGTVASNVLTHGTAGINIDACRIPGKPWTFTHNEKTSRSSGIMGNTTSARSGTVESNSLGRWPANVVLSHASTPDGFDACADGCVEGCPIAVLDAQTASRFFNVFRYQAKAPKSERPVINGKSHPTVKPLALMRWLAVLFTPPGGTVLDPFTGSGTTGEAAQLDGFEAILIDDDPASIAWTQQRLRKAG